jgi:hypothetical protein
LKKKVYKVMLYKIIVLSNEPTQIVIGSTTRRERESERERSGL